MAESPTQFVPSEFKVPDRLETKEFTIRMLTVNDVVKDYDAVMTSVEHLKTIWPGGTWPEDLTLEQDLVDLGWHQKEFQMRRRDLPLGTAEHVGRWSRNSLALGCERVARQGMAIQEGWLSRPRHQVG
jgi:hypothetical protein